MTRLPALLALLLATQLAHAAASETELNAVDRLGRVNGTVLACGYLELVPRIKGAMILYVRETREMGKTFEDATQERYRAIIGADGDCPGPADTRGEMEAAVEEIKHAFPLNLD